tara:strand:+ start:3465 stop:3644 length:180 start_codon:yes stop_codon:yes gene_type:complete
MRAICIILIAIGLLSIAAGMVGGDMVSSVSFLIFGAAAALSGVVVGTGRAIIDAIERRR